MEECKIIKFDDYSNASAMEIIKDIVLKGHCNVNSPDFKYIDHNSNYLKIDINDIHHGLNYVLNYNSTKNYIYNVFKHALSSETLKSPKYLKEKDYHISNLYLTNGLTCFNSWCIDDLNIDLVKESDNSFKRLIFSTKTNYTKIWEHSIGLCEHISLDSLSDIIDWCIMSYSKEIDKAVDIVFGLNKAAETNSIDSLDDLVIENGHFNSFVNISDDKDEAYVNSSFIGHCDEDEFNFSDCDDI